MEEKERNDFVEMYDDRQERHFLMELVKRDIVSDDDGEYLISNQKKLFLHAKKIAMNAS
jgi:hypothetical protein